MGRFDFTDEITSMIIPTPFLLLGQREEVQERPLPAKCGGVKVLKCSL